MNAVLWNCWKLQNASKHAEWGEIKYHNCVWKNSFLRHFCSCPHTMNCCPFQERQWGEGPEERPLQTLQMGREEHRTCRRDLLYLSAICRGKRPFWEGFSMCFRHNFRNFYMRFYPCCWASCCAKVFALSYSPLWIKFALHRFYVLKNREI